MNEFINKEFRKIISKLSRLYAATFITTLVLSTSCMASASDTESANSAAKMEDFDAPAYTKARPQMSFEINATLNAFGGRALTVSQGPYPIYGLNFHGEYQPVFFQKYGVLGIGPSFTIYLPHGGNITNAAPALALFSGGGQIRYQARYFREQILVPFVAFNAEYFSYNLTGRVTGSLISMGPSFGLQLLLNSLEPSAASKMHSNYNISRSYLNLEYRMLSGRDANISYSGGDIYTGLRFEF